MADPTVDLTTFRRARRDLDTTEAALRRTESELAEARSALSTLAGTGGTAGQVAAAEARVADLLTAHTGLAGDRARLLDSIHDLSRATVGRRDPAAFVRTLDGSRPVALLPVRIETRFFASASELHVRIYPDQLHLDAHEPELTAAETTAGERYWTALWGGTPQRQQDAWTELCGAMDPRRARWVVERLTPANLADAASGAQPPDFPRPAVKGEAWSRAVHATALPDRWVVVGYQRGVEVFRRWGASVPDLLATTPTPEPDTDPEQPTVAAADEPPGDDPMKWVLDYPTAERVGMAITVRQADLAQGHSLSGGLDRLVVLGVDWTLDPASASARIASLLAAHRVTDGLSFVPAGSATNNTGSVRSVLSTETSAAAADLDPAVPPAAGLDTAAHRLAAALGLEDDVLASAPGAGLLEERTASLMHQVLWRATLGHFLDELMEPVVSDATVGLAREHVEQWLRPGGPFATLRIGKQPYGVLPVVASRRFVPERADGFEADLAALLTRIRWVWANASDAVPRMGRTGDPDTDLLELMQLNPVSAVARFRKVLGPIAVANTKGMREHADAQAWSWMFWKSIAGWPAAPALAGYTADPKDHPLPVPWVQATPVGREELAPNYLRSIAASARTPEGRTVIEDEQDADTLLHALAAHAAVEELSRAGSLAVQSHLGSAADLVAAVKSIRTAEMYGVEVETASGGVRPERLERRSVTVSTPRQVASLVLPSLTGTHTVAEFVAELVAEFPERAEVRTLSDFLTALDELAGRPGEEIDHAFRGLIDACSHRYDAWATSLATRRLATIRQSRPTGVHLGGYGWVEGLRPDRLPDSLGYVHAPSLTQAAAAAILRSGHLSHRDDEHEALAIQLSSDRVQRALPVIEGAAAGQPLGALLGYRFERDLRESDDRLARYLLPIRRIAPVRPSVEPEGTGPQEAIAARDVVDGVRLLELWRQDRAAVFTRAAVAVKDRDAVATILDSLASTYDAVGDVLVAESVYQTVLGNYERAGAAMAAIDKQQRPPDPQVIRTPRTGTRYTQKVFALTSEVTARGPWQALRDDRSAAAPELNAWVSTLLPDPADIRLWGVLTSQGQDKPVSIRADALRLSPLSLVVAAAVGAVDAPSELEHRIAHALAGERPVAAGDRLEVLDGWPAAQPPTRPEEVGLAELRVLTGWILELLTNCRPVTAEDFALPGGDRASGIDVLELGRRADTAVAALDSALALAADADSGNATVARLRTALRAAASLGIPEAVPRTATGGSAAARNALRDQLGVARAVLAERRTRVDGLGAPPAPTLDGTPPPEAAVVSHHSDRLRTVFGPAFPVVPHIQVPAPDAAACGASLADATALTADDALAPRAWVDRMSLVRPGTDRLARVLTAAETLNAPGGAPGDVAVLQLPHTPAQRWLALPFAASGPADAIVAITLHGTVDLARPLAGVVCDEWVETIPGAVETTGVTFHYDAPGARAQQCVLLAVPPSATMATWDLDTLLDTVGEAAELTRLRGVTTKQMTMIGTQLPTVYLPDNFTRDRPSVDFGKLLKTRVDAIEHANVIGKGWSL